MCIDFFEVGDIFFFCLFFFIGRRFHFHTLKLHLEAPGRRVGV